MYPNKQILEKMQKQFFPKNELGYVVWKCWSFCSCCNVLSVMIYRVNPVWPNNAIWQHRSGSTLAQVMACCLGAPSHYLNQCWLIISEVLWHSPRANFTGNAQAIYPWYKFENYLFKITAAFPRDQWLHTSLVTHHKLPQANWLQLWQSRPTCSIADVKHCEMHMGDIWWS